MKEEEEWVDHIKPQRFEGVQLGRVEKRIVLRELTELNLVQFKEL